MYAVKNMSAYPPRKIKPLQDEKQTWIPSVFGPASRTSSHDMGIRAVDTRCFGFHGAEKKADPVFRSPMHCPSVQRSLGPTQKDPSKNEISKQCEAPIGPLYTRIDLSSTVHYLGRGQSIDMSNQRSPLHSLQHLAVGFSSYSDLRKVCKHLVVFRVLETFIVVTPWRHGCPRNPKAHNLRRLAYLIDEKVPDLDAAAFNIQHLKSEVERFFFHQSHKLGRKMPVVKIIILDIV